MIVDTTFLIDMEREIIQKAPGPAMEFLAHHAEQTLRISVITYGELAEGYDDPAAQELEELVAPFGIVEVTRSIARRYATISSALRISGDRWGDNDLWIGATALDADEPLLTRDRDRFSRITCLTVLGY